MADSARAEYLNDFGADYAPALVDSTQGAPDATEMEAIVAAHEGTGWVSGCAVNTPGGMSVEVDIGMVSIQGAPCPVDNKVLTVDDDDGSGWPRKDIVVADFSGVRVRKGTSNPEPVAPRLARDANSVVTECLLARIYVPADTSQGLIQTMLNQCGVPPAQGAASQRGAPIVYEPIIASDGLASLAVGQPFYSDWTWFDDTPGFEAYYIVWINSVHQPFIACRGINERYWTRFNMSHHLGETGVAPNPSDPKVGTDFGHAYIGLGMDAEGRLHLSGNEHTGPLNYVRSVNSMRQAGNLRDIEHWTDDLHMSGQNEASVSFPMFGPLPNKDLLFMSPQCSALGGGGGPDSSVVSLKRVIDGAAGTWRELGGQAAGATAGLVCLMDGEEPNTTDATAFIGTAQVDADGAVHLLFNWRPGGVVFRSIGWYYCKLTGLMDDSGDGNNVRAWRNPDGTDEITLPIARVDTGQYGTAHLPKKVAAFDPPGLINNPAPGFTPTDTAGNPHTGFTFITGDIPDAEAILGVGGKCQQFHLWYDPTLPDNTSSTYGLGGPGTALAPGWHVMQVSSYLTQGATWGTSPQHKAGGTPAGSSSRFQPLNTPDGRTYFIGCWPSEGFGGSTWCYDLTGLKDHDLPPKPYRLHDLPDQGDFHFDFNGVKNNRLIMLMTKKDRYYQDFGDPVFAAATHGNPPVLDTPAGVTAPLTDASSILGLIIIDLQQMDAFAQNLVARPTIRTVATASAAEITNIQATSPVAAKEIIAAHFNGGSAGEIVIDGRWAGKQLYTRLAFMGEMTGGGWLAACVHAQNLLEINAQCMMPGEAQNAVPVVVTDPPPGPGLNGSLTGFGVARVAGQYMLDTGDYPQNLKYTSWVALPNFRDLNGALGRLYLECWVASPTIGHLISAQWELGVLEF